MMLHLRLAFLPALLACACAAPNGAPWAPEVAAPVLGLVVGAGEHRYEWVPDWLDLPAGMELGNTHGGIAVDSQGRIYFNTDSAHAVVVVSANGELLDTFGDELAGGLHGLVIVREALTPGSSAMREVLYLVHTGRSELLKTTLDGEILWRRGYPAESGLYRSASEFNPTAIDVAPDGTLWVADGYGFQWIHHFAADGTYLESFGGAGTEQGQFRVCHGLAIDASGEQPQLWIADRENGRLQVFDLEGQWQRTISGDFRRPCSVARGPAGELVIADLAGRITLLDGTGALIAHLGDQPDPGKRANNGVPRDQWVDGEFIAPHFAKFDAEGNLYVLDWVAQGRVTKLRRLR